MTCFKGLAKKIYAEGGKVSDYWKAAKEEKGKRRVKLVGGRWMKTSTNE